MEDVKFNQWMAEFNVSSNYKPKVYTDCHYFDCSRFNRKRSAYDKFIDLLKHIF